MTPIVALFLAANLLFLLLLANRDGYEGDDLNSVLPMAHLSAAKQGLLLIYRYAWQPLSYELGAAVWRITGTPTSVFLSAPVAGALALTGLFALAWSEAPAGSKPWAALIALLGVPEFWFSSLYYNSTVIALPAAVGALLALRRGRRNTSAAMAGVAIGLAILARMDFVLTLPLLAVVAWISTRSFVRPAALIAAVIATLLAGWAVHLVDVRAIMAIQAQSSAEIRQNAHMPGWDLRAKLGVASVSLSPVGWLLLCSAPLLILHRLKERHWTVLLWPVAALPLLYPLLNILSPKYILPGAIFLPLLFVHVEYELLRRMASFGGSFVTGGLAALAALPLVFSVSPHGRSPFVEFGVHPARPVGTHDGARAYGGYLWLMADMQNAPSEIPQRREALALWNKSRTTPNLMIAGSENAFDRGGIAWRRLQLMLERNGIHGILVAPHQLVFRQAANRLLLRDVPPRVVPADAELIDLREPSGEQACARDPKKQC